MFDDSWKTRAFDVTLPTTYTPHPEGEFVQTITGYSLEELGKDKIPALKVTWLSEDPRATEAMGGRAVELSQTVWLKFTDGQLASGPNENVVLGNLLEACGLNRPGWYFDEFLGRTCLNRVEHKTGQNGRINANVVANARA